MAKYEHVLFTAILAIPISVEVDIALSIKRERSAKDDSGGYFQR